MHSIRSRTLVSVVLGLTLIMANGAPARADYIINFYEIGDNVVAIGSGSFDTEGLSPSNGFYESPYIWPSTGRVVLGGSLPSDPELVASA